MSGEISINFGNVNRLLAAMNEVGDQAGVLDSYMADSVCSTAGFDYASCALKPIGDQLDKVSTMFDQATNVFTDKWADLGDAVATSVKHHTAQDEAIADKLKAYRGDVLGADTCWSPPEGYTKSYFIRPLEIAGAEGQGETQKHDPKFQKAADAWDMARDTINKILDKVRAIVDLGRLPELSLRDYIVYPLSGNYVAIQANAQACTHLDDAMATWGKNFAHLSGGTVEALRGLAGAGLAAQMGLYGKTMATVGDVVGRGKAVFTAMATMSERIAVKVERVLTKLGEKLLSLAKRIGKRLNPVINGALSAFTAVTKGPQAVYEEYKDIVNDVIEIIETIDKCLAMVDEVRTWAQERADQIAKLHEILDAVSGLPGVGKAPGLGAITRKVGSVDKSLSDIKLAGDTGAEAANLLKGLAGLGQETGVDPAPPPPPPPPPPAGPSGPGGLDSLRVPAGPAGPISGRVA